MYWDWFVFEQKDFYFEIHCFSQKIFILFITIFSRLFGFFGIVKNICCLKANLRLRACLAMCLIFQENRGWRAYKHVAYKKSVRCSSACIKDHAYLRNFFHWNKELKDLIAAEKEIVDRFFLQLELRGCCGIAHVLLYETVYMYTCLFELRPSVN